MICITKFDGICEEIESFFIELIWSLYQMVLPRAYGLLSSASAKISYNNEIYQGCIDLFQIQVYKEKSIESKEERIHQTY